MVEKYGWDLESMSQGREGTKTMGRGILQRQIQFPALIFIFTFFFSSLHND